MNKSSTKRKKSLELTVFRKSNTLLRMVKAVFPGTFDPVTFGHIDVIKRTKDLFEKLYVVVAVNTQKNGMFTPEERKSFLEEILAPYENVSVHICSDLIVDFAKQNHASVIIRGVRSVPDFSYEFDLSIMNRTLDPSIETLFIPTDPKYFVLRSSAIKELANFDADLSNMVPENVVKALKRRKGK